MVCRAIARQAPQDLINGERHGGWNQNASSVEHAAQQRALAGQIALEIERGEFVGTLRQNEAKPEVDLVYVVRAWLQTRVA